MVGGRGVMRAESMIDEEANRVSSCGMSYERIRYGMKCKGGRQREAQEQVRYRLSIGVNELERKNNTFRSDFRGVLGTESDRTGGLISRRVVAYNDRRRIGMESVNATRRGEDDSGCGG